MLCAGPRTRPRGPQCAAQLRTFADRPGRPRSRRETAEGRHPGLAAGPRGLARARAARKWTVSENHVDTLERLARRDAGPREPRSPCATRCTRNSRTSARTSARCPGCRPARRTLRGTISYRVENDTSIMAAIAEVFSGGAHPQRAQGRRWQGRDIRHRTASQRHDDGRSDTLGASAGREPGRIARPHLRRNDRRRPTRHGRPDPRGPSRLHRILRPSDAATWKRWRRIGATARSSSTRRR